MDPDGLAKSVRDRVRLNLAGGGGGPLVLGITFSVERFRREAPAAGRNASAGRGGDAVVEALFETDTDRPEWGVLPAIPMTGMLSPASICLAICICDGTGGLPEYSAPDLLSCLALNAAAGGDGLSLSGALQLAAHCRGRWSVPGSCVKGWLLCWRASASSAIANWLFPLLRDMSSMYTVMSRELFWILIFTTSSRVAQSREGEWSLGDLESRLER